MSKKYYIVQAIIIIGCVFMILSGLKLFVVSLGLLSNLAAILNPGFTIGLLKLTLLFVFNIIGFIFGWIIGASIVFIATAILIQRKEFFN